ncbi:MAG: acetylxylan esterase [Chloroflexi bacterium]|nr:acetylxylan esterase [Chloroflexota bacterium]
MATREDLENFVSRVTRPEDFGDYWTGVLEGLAEIPLDPQETPAPIRSNADVHVSQVSYHSLGGLEIACWYCVPTGGDGPFPAILHFPGYKGEPGIRRDWGSKGVITLTVAVRGKLRSNSQFDPGYPGLLTHGIEDRDTYSYKGLISDCVRGVDFLLSRPEVDPDRIYACGSSQGGGLTLITTALRPEIKGGVSGYPFLCCYAEAMQMLRSYPYDELNCYARAYPSRVSQMLETLRYFDAVNFAGWIKCPMAVGIALEDEICPPETSYAAYKALAGPKDLWLFPDSGHGNAHDYPAKETAWLENQIRVDQG